MSIDFDRHIDRHHTSSLKWERYKEQDILPLWVADTDFAAPPAVLDALHQRIDHGVLGYTLPPASLTQAVVERMDSRYQWQIDSKSLVWLPGVVTGLNLACRAVATTGDDVVLPTPIYPPFFKAPVLNARNAIAVPLTEHENGRWTLDAEALENAITPQTRILLFCNPQNPSGTVYRRRELESIAKLAIKHDLIVVSDEIHCDLILEPGLEHIPLASLNADIAARTITLMAPSKTFNIAGLTCSFAVIENPQLRKRFKAAMQGIVPDVNLLGYTAAEAAYRQGDEWNNAQIDYLRGNRDYLVTELNAIEGLSLAPVEATYLAWLDISALKLSDPRAFFEQAGVGMSPGSDFGDSRFMRLNFGCPRDLLEEAVKRITTKLKNG